MLIYQQSDREVAQRLHERVCNVRAVSYFGAFTTHVSIEKLLFVSVDSQSGCSKLSSQFHNRLKIDLAPGPFFVVSPGRRYNTQHEVMAVSLWVNQKDANIVFPHTPSALYKKISPTVNQRLTA